MRSAISASPSPPAIRRSSGCLAMARATTDVASPGRESHPMIQPIATREARGDRPRLSRDWFVYLAVLLAAAGLVCVVIGSLMPAYTEPVVAERIRSGAECERGVPNTNENRQCDSALWHRSMDTLRTNKWSLVDGGGGLLASASMMFVFCWWSGQKSWRRWL